MTIVTAVFTYEIPVDAIICDITSIVSNEFTAATGPNTNSINYDNLNNVIQLQVVSLMNTHINMVASYKTKIQAKLNIFTEEEFGNLIINEIAGPQTHPSYFNSDFADTIRNSTNNCSIYVKVTYKTDNAILKQFRAADDYIVYFKLGDYNR
jgi:hypothetical protein